MTVILSARWRRKVEKDEQYVSQLRRITQSMESCIKQNNGIDIYLEYFSQLDRSTECEPAHSKTVGLVRDPEQIDAHVRPVSDLSFKLTGDE